MIGPRSRGAVIDAFGARWLLDVSGLDDHLADELLHLWDRALVAQVPDADLPPFVVPRTEQGRVEVDGNEQATDDPDVPYLVSRCLTIASIRRRAGSCVMLHAAGVATDDGGTVALVASSGTGRTTAGRLLGRSLGYVGDETATIEHDLTVRPYPKPLSIVVDPGGADGQARAVTRRPRAAPCCAGAAARGGRGARPERRRRGAEAGADRAGRRDGVRAAADTCAAEPGPPPRPVGAGARHHGPYRLAYRHIEDCVDLVTELGQVRDRHAIGDVTWTWFDGQDHAGAPTPVPDDLGTSTVVCRTSFRDAVASDGAVLLMRDWVPITLPGLAANLWLAADRPVAVSDLVAAAEDEPGPHPDADGIVLATVRMHVEGEVLHVV